MGSMPATKSSILGLQITSKIYTLHQPCDVESALGSRITNNLTLLKYLKPKQ
jgi:hypothetical protein